MVAPITTPTEAAGDANDDNPRTDRRTFRFIRDDLETPLGMGMNSLTGTDLYVQSVRPGGFVERWNVTNPSMDIVEGDIIAQVNDLKDNPEEMVKELQKEMACTLTIERVADSR